MKYNGPKVRMSRKLGVPLTPKADKYRERKPYPPGQHGMRRRRRMSNYGMQLLEKQRLRFQYNVSERQMRNYFKQATRMRGVVGDNLVMLLETRLDSIVHRAGFAPTIYAARQYAGHGHFTVNGQRADVPSYQVQAGDVVAIRPKSQKLRMFNEQRVATTIPSYISVDDSGYQASLTTLPVREDVPIVCEEQLVIEFYSR